MKIESANMKIILLNLLLVLSSATMAKSNDFWVSFVGKSNSRSKLQAKTELDILKAYTGYNGCHGKFIARRTAKWSCLRKKEGELCTAKFNCDFVNKKSNVLTLTRYIKRRILKAPGKIYKVKILVTNKRPKTLREKNAIFKRLLISTKMNNKRVSKVIAKNKKHLAARYKSAEGLDESDLVEYISNYESEDLLIKEAEEGSSEEKIAQELNGLRGDEEWKVSERRKTEKGENLYIVTPGEKRKISKEKIPIEWNFLNFSIASVTVKDSIGNSQSSFHYAWIPTVWLDQSWGVRTHLGLHTLDYDELLSSTGQAESFSVIDASLLVNYRFSTYYLEVGVGVEAWGDALGGSYFTTQLGIGKSFKKYAFYKVDRIFLNALSVSDDKKKYSEVRFGISFSI